VALDAQAAALVYIYARISQIAEMALSFYATEGHVQLYIFVAVQSLSAVITLDAL
jgi:hypothetical protein